MSLYDDLIEDNDNQSDGWAQTSGRRLLAQHLQNKTKANQMKAKPIRREIKCHDESSASAAIPAISALPFNSKGSLLGGDWAVGEEYDPIWPNDYEKAREERREKRHKEQRKPQKRTLGLDYDDEEDDKCDADDDSRRRAGAAIAPPPSLVDSCVAKKIMAKMGYKEGQGLGREEQGMASPLLVEKTSKRGGKIVDATPVATPVESITEIMKTPSKVVLLRNMVAKGEVDELLEEETKEECGKYGDVMRVVIFEVPEAEHEFPVRIFVEFRRIESAIKAVVDLNGRYFGGRVVRANFYDVERFKKLDFKE